MRIKSLLIIAVVVACVSSAIILVDPPAFSITRSGKTVLLNYFAKASGKKLTLDSTRVCAGKVTDATTSVFL